MEKAAIYHRPQSEMSYLAAKNVFQVRLRTKHADVDQVEIIYGALDKIKAQRGTDKDIKKMARPQVDAMKLILKTDLYDYWEAQIPVKVRERTQYVFHLISRDDEVLYDAINARVYMADFLDNTTPFDTPYYQNMLLPHTAPEWSTKTVWYEIMIDRFANGSPQCDPIDVADWQKDKSTKDNFFGGDFRGIIDHLDYLAGLGITGIKLSPIFESYSNLKDDPIDFYDLSMLFGGKEDFRELVQKAHQHKIKVILQLPLDRLSDLSLQWQDVQMLGERSHFASWFMIRDFPVTIPDEEHPQVNYLDIDGNVHMPKLNLQDTTVQQYLLETSRYWIETFDIDGWEILNGDEIDPTFLNLFTKQMHSIKSDFLVVGNYHYFPYQELAIDHIDSANNVPFKTICNNFFIRQKINVSDMISQLNEELMKNMTHINEVVINELENLDTPRLFDQCKGHSDLACAMLAFMFLQKGAPLLLYGTEVGVTGNGVPGNRAPMVWDEARQNQNMLQFIKGLVGMRNDYPEIFKKGTLDWGQSSNKYRFFTLSREYEGKKIFSLFNLGFNNIKVVIPQNSQLIVSQSLNEEQSTIGPNGFMILVMQN